MGSRRTRSALRRRAGVAFAVWAVAFLMLAAVAAIPEGPSAALAVDNAYPVVGEVVRFDASGSLGHDAGNGRIVGYRFAFGDGQETEWLGSSTTTHGYVSDGNVTATVTVRDLRGQSAAASVAVHVGVLPPLPPGTPDLILVQIILTPARPRVNDTVNVTVLVLNRGNANATSATVDAYDVPPDRSETFVGRVGLSHAIAPEASVLLRFPGFTAAQVGNHTMRAILANVTPDGTNVSPHELDESYEVVAGPAQPGLPSGAPAFEVGAVTIGLVAAAVAGISGAAYLLLRRPPKGPLEPPSAPPPDRSPPPIWPP